MQRPVLIPSFRRVSFRYLVARLDGLSHEEAEATAEDALRTMLKATAAMAKTVNDEADRDFRARSIVKWSALLQIEEARRPDSERAKYLRRVIEDLKSGRPLREITDAVVPK